ncbi:hypothetical protein [Candidatus Nitrososphaera evergladensis]|uniref:hypothetical protein n=1 Tax=Candidatus Nitrososphaera evergladensis TaxID=1459637 RepID=UPI0011E5DF03|nr:hypothetical protein [Candidatus Nitrososphaera evergladensis]
MAYPTEAATFRFDKKLLAQLRLESKEKRINLNTVLNQIVRSHIEWHANAAKAGFMPIRKALIKRLFDPMTKEQIDALAADVSRGLIEETMMIIMTSQRTEEPVFELLERWIRVSGFNYRHEVTDDSHIFVIQHNMGENWSHYMGRLFEEAASEFMRVKPDTQVTENALFIRIREVYDKDL